MRGALFALVLLTSTVPAVAAPGLDSYRRLNEDAVARHVLPRYDRLVAATAALHEATGGACAQPGAAGLDMLRERWRAAAAAWQGVQHIRFGPIELFMRGMRFAFWPDTRNSVGRGLEEVIAGRASASISGETFARGAVAVQGLPALERLLFGAESAPKLLAGDAEAGFRCATVQAIGSNLADLAGGIRRDWIEGAEPFAKAMSGGGPHADAKEATGELFKSLHAAVEIVADHKLARPLGVSAQTARPQLAEAFHSRTSMDNIRANLEAAESLYLGGGGMGFAGFVRDVAGDKALDDLFKRAFAQTRATAASVAMPLEEAVSDPAERRKLMQLARETSALKALLAQRLTTALDIPVGFNALDGD